MKDGIELPEEIVTVNGITYHLVPVTDASADCDKCCFSKERVSFCDKVGNCQPFERKDKLSVIFKRKDQLDKCGMIEVIWSEGKTHGILYDRTGSTALVVPNKIIFIGVDKNGKACFRDIHDAWYSESILKLDNLEHLNELLKIADVIHKEPQ